VLWNKEGMMVIDGLRRGIEIFFGLVNVPPQSLKQVGISTGLRLIFLIILAGIGLLIAYLEPKLQKYAQNVLRIFPFKVLWNKERMMVMDGLRRGIEIFFGLVNVPPQSLKQVGISIGLRLIFLIILAGIGLLIAYLLY
jgi:hypothetical protein